MKDFIKHKLKTSLNEMVKGGSYTVYHGSPTRITNFTDEFVGGKEANDQEGPGIYLTSSKEDASRYGEFIHTIILTPRLLLDKTPTNSSKLRPLVTKMIKMAPDWKDTAQNWDENPLKGLQIAIEDVLSYNDTEKDVVQQVWVDFYRYKSVEYVRNMVKMGIDGLSIIKDFDLYGFPNTDKVTHFIIYNPAIIKLQN